MLLLIKAILILYCHLNHDLILHITETSLIFHLFVPILYKLHAFIIYMFSTSIALFANFTKSNMEGEGDIIVK